MSGSINKVMLVGNLGKDPEIRHTTDGKRIATLSIATSEFWKDKITGERKDKTEWHRTVIFNDKLAEIAEKYLRKGSKVYLEGQLQTRKWTNNEGQEQMTTEVVLSQFKGDLTLLDSKGSQQLESGAFGSGASSNAQFDRSNTYPYNQLNNVSSAASSATPAFAASSTPTSSHPTSSSILEDDIPF